MKALRIEPEDNVAVVAQDTRKGDVLRHAGGEVTALEDIGLGHKNRRRSRCAGGARPQVRRPHRQGLRAHCRRSLRAYPQS